MIMLKNKITPKISVLMPINRDDGFFDQALDSVLNQTITDFELVILANNCDDDLWHRIMKIQDNRVISKRLSIGGLAFALNTGLHLARGEYIARMDADDICLPNRLEAQLRFMDERSDVDVLGARVQMIDASGAFLNEHLPFLETHEEIASQLPYGNRLIHPTVFARKKVLIEGGGYKYGFTGEDYELWIRLMLDGKIFHNLNENLLYYRRHDAQMTGDAKGYLVFCEIFPMLVMFFLKTGKTKFLIGAISKIPVLKKIRKLLYKKS